MPPPGFTLFNCRPSDAEPESTIIISGPSRSGTSLVSTMAKAVGLWLGDLRQTAVFEDQDIAHSIEPHQRPMIRAAVAARNIYRPALALRGVDVLTLEAKIAVRNSRFQKWGFKRPNIVPILGNEGFKLFRKPRLIITLRDPAAIAERIVLARDNLVKNPLQAASDALAKNIAAVSRLTIPVMVVSYEKASQNPEGLFTELCDFCGLAEPDDGYQSVKAFVENSQGEYQRLAAGTIHGYVERYADGMLVGWCRIPGEERSVDIDVYIDDAVVARGRADIFRRDVGHHSYRVPLEASILTASSRVSVRIAGTDIELENSGQQIADLSRPGL